MRPAEFKKAKPFLLAGGIVVGLFIILLIGVGVLQALGVIEKPKQESKHTENAGPPKPPAESPVVFDAFVFGGATLDVMTSKLGAPRCEPAYQPAEGVKLTERQARAQRCFWNSDAIEIVFTDAGADWFTLTDSRFEFSEKAIVQLGFNKQLPTFRNENVIRWEGAQGTVSIDVFSNGRGGTNFVKVWSKTQPD